MSLDHKLQPEESLNECLLNFRIVTANFLLKLLCSEKDEKDHNLESKS
jgi:hypothetical protein